MQTWSTGHKCIDCCCLDKKSARKSPEKLLAMSVLANHIAAFDVFQVHFSILSCDNSVFNAHTPLG